MALEISSQLLQLFILMVYPTLQFLYSLFKLYTHTILPYNTKEDLWCLYNYLGLFVIIMISQWSTWSHLKSASNVKIYLRNLYIDIV